MSNTGELSDGYHTFNELYEYRMLYNALVVLARHVKEKEPDSPPSLWANLGDGLWGHVETTKRATVRELRDVTPLYPKEGQDA